MKTNFANNNHILLILFLCILFGIIIFSNKVYADRFSIQNWKYKISEEEIDILNSKVDWNEFNTSRKPVVSRGFVGYIYYRANIFRMHDDYSNGPNGIFLDKIYDVDEVYIDGFLIGKTGRFPPNFDPYMDLFRLYLIPPKVFSGKSVNTLLVKVYVGYGFRQGIDISKVSIEPYKKAQRKYYFKYLIWSVTRIAMAFLCILIAFIALPWIKNPTYRRAELIVFILGLSACIFVICYSRLQFHFFSVFTSYRIHCISSIIMAASLLFYILILSLEFDKSWIYKSFFFLIVAIPATMIAITLLMQDRFVIDQIFQVWIYTSMIYPFIGIIFLLKRNLWKSHIFFFIGIVVYALCGVHDTIDNTFVLNRERLADFGIAFVLLFLFIQKIKDNKQRMVNIKIESARELARVTKLAAVGQTTAMLAHDVKKPFSMLKIVLKNFEKMKSNPNELKEAKKDVERSIKNVEGMVADIMDYSREVKLETKPCAITNILDFVVRETAQSFANCDISFKYNLKNQFMPLVDDERIARVFSNIISNAIEAITVIGKKDKGDITIDALDNEKFIAIKISNDGPLLNEEDIPNLFESIFTKGKRKGTGLGLASAHKIVTLHDGKISARNTEGKKGVEFIIELPVSKEKEKHDLSALPQNINEAVFSRIERDEAEFFLSLRTLSKQREIYKIVLLEDETLYRASVRNTIRTNKELDEMITLYEAEKVDDALELVEKEKVTHAIVDIDLSDFKDGYDFLTEVIKRKLNVSCLVHSNRYLEEFVKKAYELGAKGYVSKPLRLEDLVSFLSKGKRKSREPEKNVSNIKKLSCFIVDDTNLIRSNLERIAKKALQEFDLDIYGFETPEKAIERFNNINPDIVISDFDFGEISEMTGEEFLTNIKKQKIDMLTYLASGLDESQLKEKVKKIGATGYFNPSEIKSNELRKIILKDL